VSCKAAHCVSPRLFPLFGHVSLESDVLGNGPASFGKGVTEKGHEHLAGTLLHSVGGSQKPGLETAQGAGSPPNIADLLQHGLVRPSFVPPAPQREVRELTRYRISLSEERSRLINRLQKTLEDANIKLASVASDVMGRSARDILAALLAGEVDPAVLAELARGRLRAKRDLLAQALQGQLKSHHRFLISEQLTDIDELDEAIERMSTEIAERLRPYEHQIQRLSTIPGIKRRLP
jgi:hypothetical protein